MRNQFHVTNRIQKATACVFGFGFYELHLNGVKVGENVLAPVNSNYDKWGSCLSTVTPTGCGFTSERENARVYTEWVG